MTLSRYAYLILLVLSILLLLITAFKGLFFPDEGYIVNSAQRILDGQVLYRDFDFVYTPLTAYATSLAFFLGGSSILSERIFNLLISLGTGFALVKIGQRLSSHPILQLIPLTTYIAWGPSHINFIWPGMWAVNFGIIAMYFLYEAVKRNLLHYYFFSGIFISFILLTKQNFGVAALITLIFLFLLLKSLRTRKAGTYTLLGVTFPIVIFLLYTLVTNSTASFLHNFYIHVIQLILIQGSINTPLLVGSHIVISLAKFIFYSTPLLVSAIATYLLWRKDRAKIILVSFVAIFYLFGFRPVTDYVHLTPLLSLTGIPLLILITQSTKQKRPFNFIPYTFYFILLSLGIWSSLFFGYYRWSPPLITQNTYLSHPRINIWVDDATKQKVETFTLLLDEYSKPGDKVFLNYYAPMVYFISNRRNPTRYDYTGLPEEYQREIIQTLERKNIQTILTFTLNKNDNSVVGEYIQQNYQKQKTLDEYDVWLRK